MSRVPAIAVAGRNAAPNGRLRAVFCVSAAFIICVAAAACAPMSKLPQIDKAAAELEAEKQRELVVDDLSAQYGRLVNVAFPVMEKNADLCGDVTRASMGIFFINKFMLGAEYEKTLSARGIGDTATIFALASGSPASQSGLRVGDSLVAVGDWKIPGGKNAAAQISDKMQAAAKQSATVHLTVANKDGTREVNVPTYKVCDYEFGVILGDQINAAADGKHIVVTSGMMRFAQTDLELATVFGHEMAHNIMEHMDKKRGNAILGAILDILLAGAGVNTQGGFSKIGAGAYSQEFEQEADYVGLYLMARAGFSVDGTANLWRRMGATHPGAVSSTLATSHPATPERFLALEQTAAEIDAKIASGASLMPEVKPKETKPAVNPQQPLH